MIHVFNYLMHLTAISISILIYLCRLVDEVGKTRKPSVLDSVDEEAIAFNDTIDGKATDKKPGEG